jgi:type II secretory pathway component PulJ
MSRTPTKRGIRSQQHNSLLERQTQRFQELKRGLEQLECFCKGTVLKRMMKCGKAQCACASDPAKRHGPYFELTYKANGKTVNVKLSPQAAPLYRAASLQYRKLKGLLNRLEKLSQSILRHQAKLAESNRQD